MFLYLLSAGFCIFVYVFLVCLFEDSVLSSSLVVTFVFWEDEFPFGYLRCAFFVFLLASECLKLIQFFYDDFVILVKVLLKFDCYFFHMAKFNFRLSIFSGVMLFDGCIHVSKIYVSLIVVFGKKWCRLGIINTGGIYTVY